MRWLETRQAEPEEWQRAAQFGDTFLYLTPEELAALGEQTQQMVDQLHRPAGPPGTPAAGGPPGQLPPPGLPAVAVVRPPAGGAGPRARPGDGRPAGRERPVSIAVAPGRLASRHPPLLRQTAFRRYWGAQSISLFGRPDSSIALPLAAVLALHASPAEMGYLSALIWLPSLLFALHAGAWVDRRGHRRATMIAADLGRAALLASIPVCSALGVLTLAQLFAVAFAAGTLSIFFTVSDSGLFVALVPGDATSRETR